MLAKVGVGVLRSLLKNGNGLRIQLHAPVEVRRGTYHAEYLRIVVIERLHISLRGCEIFAALVQTGECVAQLQSRDGVRSQGRLPFQGVLPHGFQGFLLREIFDFGGLLDGVGGANHGIQIAHQLRLAVLHFEDAHAQENGSHGSPGGGRRFLRFAVDKVAELRPRGQGQEPRLRL